MKCFNIFKFKSCKNKGFDEKNLRCPRCKVIMKKIQKEDVIIDVCETCNGMWLDDHEIEKLAAIANRSTKSKTKAKSKSKSKNKTKK